MTNKYFGTDGIRGRANVKLTPDLALRVGQSAGVALRRGKHRPRALIGKDTRLSSDIIEGALVAGFTSAGVDAVLLGTIPTPAVAMATRCMGGDLGVMISASHNSYEDNGIKLFNSDGYKLSDELEARIESLLETDITPMLAGAVNLGRVGRIDIQARYVEVAKRTLGRKVRETRADIGIALDGDANRMILVDEKGNVVDGDQVMAVLAESWRDEGRLTKSGIVATIMSNLGLERHLAGLGLGLERTAVGDRYVIERMREGGYNLGGEQSGHLIVADYSTTRDGLVAAIRLLEVVQSLDKPVSDICHRFEPLPQVLRNIRFGSGRPLDNAVVAKVIKEATARLGSGGRLVVRPSGTEPLIRVMGEAEDKELVDSLISDVCDAVAQAA
ncbi:phosphoglucosamine mutase [Bradyrhizobium sp. MOS002]|uniref:phosphoglucosamine mutase n=1 Tax=Bradyrhizobium sp. MOS002 TaxID=2133947 RepID=UPI000D12B892|nr:phosphoglucosamine mutase [Bradyrhizobium sp. MOS002]PSO16664.1 phosphoglucosamine mutase [Bradyrhizobium sp. MOS002]